MENIDNYTNKDILFNDCKCKYYSNSLNIDNLDIPLVVSYENDFDNNINSHFFRKTLEKNKWEYMFIGENVKWNGVKNKINGYYNLLVKLPLKKIIVLSDARDVICVKKTFFFMNDIKNIISENKLIISSELFLQGDMDWDDKTFDKYIKKDPNFFWQGVPLNNYWNYYKMNNQPSRKYVNSGLIIGKVENLITAFKWIIDNNYNDDQLGFANYSNNFPQLVHLDYNADILHTSVFGGNGGLYDIHRQKHDSPTFSELMGLSNYFLHIPGIIGVKGQKYVYETICKIFDTINLNDMYSLYGITPRLDNDYFIKNTDK